MSSTKETVKQPKSTSSITQVDKKAMNLAASWYIAMESKDLGKKPKAIELFGQQLVAWRDQTGHPVIMARYCSHMGASLAIGEVVDGCIRCPYHHWRYDGSGQCVSLPEVEHIPPTARQATYVTVERYGYIWVWYGSETPVFPLPEFPAFEAQKHNYISCRFMYYTKTTVRQLVEGNTCDYYHQLTLHKQKTSSSIRTTVLDDQYPALQSEPPIQKEACFRVLMEIPIQQNLGHPNPVIRALGFNAEILTFQIDVWPSGFRKMMSMDGNERMKLLMGTTPVTENNTILHYLVMMKKTSNFVVDKIFGTLVARQAKIAALEDISVFNTLRLNGRGTYVKYDHAILKFREFYQNWVNKAE